MATINASTVTPAITGAAIARKSTLSLSPVLGLPHIGGVKKGGSRVRCSSGKATAEQGSNGVAGASLLAAAASVMSVSSPALALVDERMSTEGTGLSLGVSNNLLGWILLGVFALIWALFFVYTSTLEEDEESGLSL